MKLLSQLFIDTWKQYNIDTSIELEFYYKHIADLKTEAKSKSEIVMYEFGFNLKEQQYRKAKVHQSYLDKINRAKKENDLALIHIEAIRDDVFITALKGLIENWNLAANSPVIIRIKKDES